MIIKQMKIWAVGFFLLALVLIGCTPKADSPTPVTIATPDEIRGRIDSADSPLLLVHAWATWCDPCREEFPELIQVYNEFKDQGLEMMLVSADEPSEKTSVEAFLNEHNCPVGSLISTELSQKFIETLSPKWGGSLPSSFFFSKGKLVAEWEGKRTHQQYAEKINELLTP